MSEGGRQGERGKVRPSEALAARRDEVRAIIARYPVANPRVFGSVARGEDTAESDLDILVDKRSGLSLYDIGGLAIELEDLLGVRVDIVLASGLRDHVAPSVFEDARPL